MAEFLQLSWKWMKVGKTILQYLTKVHCIPWSFSLSKTLSFNEMLYHIASFTTKISCFTWISQILTHKYSTSLERKARDKHSSFLQTLLNGGRKKFYNVDTRSFCLNVAREKFIRSFAVGTSLLIPQIENYFQTFSPFVLIFF